MLEFDKDQDGKLTNDEITDPRLHRLFDQADADKDGIVTNKILTSDQQAQLKEMRQRGPGGFGPPGGGRPGGFGPPGEGPPPPPCFGPPPGEGPPPPPPANRRND
jgi:hypothetical protein